MSGKKALYYWDSCIYIAILMGEECSWLQAAEELLEKNLKRENIIITSTVTYVEVLERTDPEAEKRFLSMFKPGEHELLDVDIRVAQKARRLKSHFNALDPRVVLGTADAIHLATAILNEAVEFHTNDKGKSKDEENRKTVGLLNIKADDLPGDRIKICLPELLAPSLFQVTG